MVPRQIDTLDEAPQPFLNEDHTIAMMFEGKIYNDKEIKSRLRSIHKFRSDCSGEILVHQYEADGDDFLDQVNGKFVFALWDERNQKLVLGRDRLGIEPLYYYRDNGRLIFCTSLRFLMDTGWIEKRLNHAAVLQYLLYCYNPGDETFFQKVYKLPAGHVLSQEASAVSLKKYWHLRFDEIHELSEGQYREEIPALIRDAIGIRLETDRPPGILLSGGTDSSTLVSMTSRLWDGPFRTFSFRCEGRSFDESSYARLIAGRFGTIHTEVSFDPDQAMFLNQAVDSMEEPFCDIGIEVGTFLLGQAAHGEVSYVFSGEGGDELFGGHPVYVANELAAVADRIPHAIKNPVTRVLQKIPDGEQKVNLQVKLKRFSYGLSFPAELLSHRWRTYYTPDELLELCNTDFIGQSDLQTIYKAMMHYSCHADGGDRLSRSLYSDYHTLVGFYFRRLGLLRAFSIESRLPLMDHRLVEYAAKIPSNLKIKGLSDTKYIYKKVLEGVVPEEILTDRPKLGHGVPMKNWLRIDEGVRTWMEEVFSDHSFKERGFINPSFIKRMVDEHRDKSHNHSHRLWGLVVLELWLRSCLDT